MNSTPYCNEPSFENDRHVGRIEAYNRNVRMYTAVAAILDHVRPKPKSRQANAEFMDVIQTHLRHKRAAILATTAHWAALDAAGGKSKVHLSDLPWRRVLPNETWPGVLEDLKRYLPQ